VRGLRIKPGREASILAAVLAFAMGIFGIVVLAPAFASGPSFGPPGSAASGFVTIWIIAAFGIAAFYAYNAFSKRGASLIDIDTTEAPSWSGTDSAEHAPLVAPAADFETRLRKLEALKQDGLITDSEYDSKRAEILSERW
jgi:hypothetical protein